MRLYNTLTHSKEEFRPLRPGKVGFYICGPTVYNDIHIGNARTFLSFDVIRRYLEYSGYDVDYVQNITDVDDKIINRAREEGRAASELAGAYTQAFIEVMRAVGVQDPTIRPRATEEIPSMVSLIECLVESGHAYAVEGDVYFSVRSFAEYGCLSGRRIDDLVAGARVEVDERKHDPLDFALWKAAKPGEPSWPSPWGAGRPGWHIECSAMSERYLGLPFDIHAGGEDLIFPHHENELAQSEACYHNGFAKYWLHGGMLTIDKEKMSKSEGNFLLLKDVLEQVRPEALRLLMLQTHYRSPFDYSPARLAEATVALERIEGTLGNIAWAVQAAKPSGKTGTAADGQTTSGEASAASLGEFEDETGLLAGAHTRFKAYMDDDFNTAGAVAVVFELVSEANHILAEDASTLNGDNGDGAGVTRTPVVRQSRLRYLQALGETIIELLAVLGVELKPDTYEDSLILADDASALFTLAGTLGGYQGTDTDEALAALLKARAEAREARDWAQADAVRDGIATFGLVIEDTPQGPRLTHA
ncbi:MAG: cysteine--tRNA ligase [Coriobacteriales bacterium]|jgi:cysteinyl-tRNA synthetase|nr:cysteine--tRNA ligase [Coriobacteriales bacterium]